MKTISTLLYTLLTALFMLTATNANAQSWNFSTMSQTDQDNCKTDANWVAGTGRYGYVLALDNETLIANSTELEYTQGLLFTANAPSAPEDGKAKIRCNYDKGQLELNGNGVQLTIPGLKQGQVVTVKCITGKSNVERGLEATNLSGTTGFGESAISANELTCTGTVAADGNVTITTIIGGMNIYSITITDESGEVTPPTTNYNDVPLNTAENQMRLTLGSEIKYYNTDDVNVAFDRAAGTVTVTPIDGTWQDVYTKTVNRIDFAIAQPTGGDGDIQEGEINITEAKGWQESLYAKWDKYNGAESYNVYVKGGNYSGWTKIDEQLVRDYGSYARADVVGLVSGSDYAIKVVAVDGEGKEVSGVEGIAENMTVTNYDRSGYAHFNRTEGVGAYNNDGSLKKDAVVLYITNDNFNTIQYDMTINSKGGKETRTGLGNILQAFEKGYETRPFAIRFIGQIKDVDNSQLMGDADALQIKGKDNKTAMNITFEGIGDDATWYGWGLVAVKANNIEIRNIATMLFADDGFSIKESLYMWIHNNDIFYGNPGSASDQAKGDGSLDVKDDSQYCTFSYNHFWDSGKSSLCGMKSETGENWLTYHHNWFDHTDSRTPRVRTMTVHVYNNYYDGISKYGVGATMGSSVFVENNYFRNTKYPMLISLQGSDISGDGDGTFSGENGGIIKSYGNTFNGKYTYVPYQEDNTQFDAYEASTRDEQVPSSVKTLEGGTSYNNFDIDSKVFYVDGYTPDAAADVPTVVTGYYGAGRLNHGDFTWTFNNSVDDEDYGVNTELKNKILSYETSLVKIYGDENAESGEQGGEGGDEGGTTEPGGGDEGGETGDGGDTPVIEGAITCSFGDNTWTNSDFFDITGNTSNSKGSVTINGTEYTYCLKMESSTSIKFTIDKPMTLNLYFGTNSENKNYDIKIDDVKYEANATTRILTVQLEAGSHELAKASTSNLFYIELIPVAE